MNILKQNVFILLALLFMLSGCRGKQGDTKSLQQPVRSTIQGSIEQVRNKSGIKAPDFTLAKLNGEKFSLSEFEGQVVLLNFWGTWCAPCLREIPDFIELQNNYQTDGLQIVGITLSSGSAQNIQAFVDKWGMNYTVLTDIRNYETHQVTNEFGKVTGRPITGIPTTFLIDRDGYIVKAYIGPRTEEIFLNDIKPYL
jgi:peroxiredoxin